ncbi:TIGR04222 domain-containing membrane protein [Allokutzneria oryzae]|uniref:TIGR04222 domain-containing membrane protein n=1 Tax=Allokutzneria oryzae TaxID=1378989 RepID=A0ABV5ZY30_9PSEU
MTEPWGISGPTFIVLYCALIVGLVVLNKVWAGRQRRGGDLGAPVGALIPPPYHLAYLVGGARRAAETAVASLLADGRLRIASAGTLTRTSEQRTPDPLENAVLDKANSVRARTVVELVAGSPACAAIAEDLSDRGLLVSPDAAKARLRRIFLLFLALEVLGIVRVANGISLDRPVGFLIPLVVVAGIATVVAGIASAVHTPGRRTVLGDRVAAEARGRYSNHHADEPGLVGVSTFGFAAGAVLFGGLMLYPDEQIQQALNYSPPPVSTSGGGSDGGSGGSDSGGGCSGGGCGGGGCGGCGG